MRVLRVRDLSEEFFARLSARIQLAHEAGSVDVDREEVESVRLRKISRNEGQAKDQGD